MSTKPVSYSEAGFSSVTEQSNIRWFVCFLLFLATTINYMDRSVFSNIEPLLHNVDFMGWDHAADKFHQPVFDNNFGNVLIFFQIAYGVGFLIAGRIIDRLGTKTGYALAIAIWGLSSMSHSLVTSVAGFCVARIFLGLGESGNFPAAIKATTEWFPANERAKAVGLFNSGTNVSFFLALPLITFVTSRWGWRASFLATGSMGAVWLIIWLIFPYNKLRRGSTTTQRELAPVMEGPDVPAQYRLTPGILIPAIFVIGLLPALVLFLTHTTDTILGIPVTVFWLVLGLLPGIFLIFASKNRTSSLYKVLFHKGAYAFIVGKGLTDGVWWFYLFYLPQFLNRNYGVDIIGAYKFILTVYVISSVGSIGGGSLSGWLMKRGYSVNAGRKIAMLSMALLVLPLVLVPHMGALFPTNPWPATLLIALAAAAHQGWSANLFSTPTDMFPSTAVSTVVGFGGAAGAVGGAVFTWLVKHNLSLHPLIIFATASSVYLLSLLFIQLLVPRLGGRADQPA
jgi:ACS family hexuronate transporter-like MFS transporter